MTAYRRLFDPPSQDEMEYVPDPLGRLGMGTYSEKPPRFADPGWEAARQDWMNGASLYDIFGDDPFTLHGSVGRDRQNRRGDVFKLQTMLHKEGHLDSEATGGPTGYWGNRDDAALRAFQKEHGLTVDGYADPDGETIRTIRGFYGPAAQPLEQRGEASGPREYAQAEPLLLNVSEAEAKDEPADDAISADQMAADMANALGLDPKAIPNSDPAILKALGAANFYRYLDQRGKEKAMQSIEALKRDHPELHGKLRATVADIVAHPQWHRDKMTPEELQSAMKALDDAEYDINRWRKALQPFLPKYARAVSRRFVKPATRIIVDDERQRLQREQDRRRDPRDR